MIRAFIAVDLPDALIEEVASLQTELKRTGADVKWVEARNLHLTLKFLGDIEETLVPTLEEALTGLVHPRTPFMFHLEDLGAFPRVSHPRVVWVGIKNGQEDLMALASSVESALSRLGIPKEERPFSPHLTIGRVRSSDRLTPLVQKLQSASFKGKVPAPVDHLTLYQSALSPQGPTYTPLAQFPLGS